MVPRTRFHFLPGAGVSRTVVREDPRFVKTFCSQLRRNDTRHAQTMFRRQGAGRTNPSAYFLFLPS